MAHRLKVALLLVAALAFGSCAARRYYPPPPPPPPGEPLTPESPADKERDEEPLPVKPVQEDIVVAAWAEPQTLPPGGGQAQILVRVQKRGGARFPGVEVRLRTSTGSLYSGGGVLTTDAQGMTRDRLTTRKTARITLNAGGTRYRFWVEVPESSP
jgi:hypothetical protein